jgi:hypothetical protein
VARTRTKQGKHKRENQTSRLEFTQGVPLAHVPKPVRGMKLKTVSALTLAFSLLCLAAFIAGHTQAPRSARPLTDGDQRFASPGGRGISSRATRAVSKPDIPTH